MSLRTGNRCSMLTHCDKRLKDLHNGYAILRVEMRRINRRGGSLGRTSLETDQRGLRSRCQNGADLMVRRCASSILQGGDVIKGLGVKSTRDIYQVIRILNKAFLHANVFLLIVNPSIFFLYCESKT